MGNNTTYSWFYKPSLGASGATELALFDTKIDATDIQIEKSKLLKGLYADMPAAALADRLYYATDNNILYKDSGSAWAAMLQGYDAGLTSIAALTTAANKMIYTTALDTYAVTTLTAFARTILDDADAATARATLSTAVLGANSDITSITGLTTALGAAYGGTGIANNAASTITITGAYTLGLTLSAATALTLPTTGTVAVTANKLSAFAATTSAELAGVISDETGTLKLVFSDSPVFTTQVTAPRIIQTNTIENTSKLLQTEDIFSDYVVTGLLPATSADLISDISAGHAYVTGVRVNKAATSNTYTASVDTYVDVNSAGTYTFPEVALGAAAPAVTADSIRLAKVVTDATAITGVTDLRKLTLTLPAPTVVLTGGQIAFPATQVPSAGANTLDDYEEGTWTPDLQFGGAKVGITYTARSGTYTKIGRFVIASFDIDLSSKGTSTGGATIAALPFTCGSTTGSCLVAYHNVITLGTWENRIDAATTGVLLCKISTDTIAALTNADFANTTRIIGTVIYNA